MIKNGFYKQDEITINAMAFNRDFDEIDFEPRHIEDGDKEEEIKYGY